MGVDYQVAKDRDSVSKLYQDSKVARTYLEKRFIHSWQKLLHDKQVGLVNRVIHEKRDRDILEIAPGPARIATGLRGVKRGVMLENSAEMIEVATLRLKTTGLLDHWRILRGNAFDLATNTDLSGTFDVIYSFRFIRHLMGIDRKRIYAAVREKLSADGYFIFDVVNKPVRDRLDAKVKKKSNDALHIYDKTYTPFLFEREMKENGFSVVELYPVLKWFEVQYVISIKLYDIIPDLHRKFIEYIEGWPVHCPLEWIAVCQKTT